MCDMHDMHLKVFGPPTYSAATSDKSASLYVYIPVL